jgi:hypothetical protein
VSRNTKKLHYAGLYDFGNDAIGEGNDFTFTANFIAWFGDVEPFVFFSNGPYDFPKINEKRAPLAGNARFIGVQWGPRTLQPGQTEVYTMTIGMAGHDPKTGFPMMPKIDLKNFPEILFLFRKDAASSIIAPNLLLIATTAPWYANISK